MDSKVKRIDEHLYNPGRTEKQYLVTKAKRLQAKTSLRYRLSKLNQPGGMFSLSGNTFNPHLKTWALIFLAITSIITGGVLSQGSLFHSFETKTYTLSGSQYFQQQTGLPNGPQGTGPDPSQFYYYADNGQVSAGNCLDFNVRSAASCGLSVTRNAITIHAIDLKPVAGNGGPSTAISKTAVDISTVSAKTLGSFFFWSSNATLPDTTHTWGIYLSRNGTVPTSTTYDPSQDVNTALFLRFNAANVAGHTNLVSLFIQRVPTETIASEDVGACVGIGACFMSLTTSAIDPVTNWIFPTFFLNYTGPSGTHTTCDGTTGLGNACSILKEGASNTVSSTRILPWLQLAQKYYVGFWVSSGGPEIYYTLNSGGPANCSGTGCNQITLYELGTDATVNTVLDSGGWFGPIINALISIGVFMLSNILLFAGYIWSLIQPTFNAIVSTLITILAAIAAIVITVIKAVLNAIGTGLGISSLGDNLFTFLGDIASFFTTFFSNAVAQLSSFLTFLTNGYSTISASFGTYWTDIANWTSGIKDLLAGLWVIAGQLFTISFAFMFSGWLLFGAKKFSDSVGEGMEWFNLTRQFIMIGVAIALFLFTMILHYVIIPSFHAIQATGEAKKTAEPDIVIGGTGVG